MSDARVERFDHVGVIVDDLEDAARLLCLLGLEPAEAIDLDEARIAYYRCGDVSVEIIEPLDPQMRRERLGEGCSARIEHLAFQVRDLGATLAALAAVGVRPNAPARHDRGRTMAWTEPATSHGIMLQLVEWDTVAAGGPE